MKIEKKDSKNNNKKNNKKKLNSKINTKYMIIIASIVVIVVIVALIVNLIFKQMEYKKYKHYEDKMYSYGFYKLYNNESAKTSESVTKSEAIKMAIGVCLNTYDVEDIANKPSEDYQNAIWVEYAKEAKWNSSKNLNKKTSDDKVKYIETINYFSDAKKKLLKLNLDKIDDKTVSDIEKYDDDSKNAILDMISNDILKEYDNNLNGNKNMFKGQLNEIVVNYIEKYNLLEEDIQTDINKLPANASDFSYISVDVDKSIYEIPYMLLSDAEAESGFVEVTLPKYTYVENKKYYSQIVEKIEKYYNTILNVDYNTTTVDELKKNLEMLLVDKMSDEDLNKYIDFIKTNQIKIIGNAKVQKPIIYFDGSNYKVRTKLKFDIENSSTNQNLLLCDINSNNPVIYEKTQNEIIVDVAIESTVIVDAYYVQNLCLPSLLPNNNSYGIHYMISEDKM